MATSREDARPLQRCGWRADGRLRYPGTYTTSWDTTSSIAQRDPVRPCTECPSKFGGREIGEDAIANGRPQNWSVA